MRLKITWTLFLRLGSLFILATVIGCKGQVDAWVKADWVFENTSTHKIEVVSKDFNSFVLLPGESYTFEEEGDGPEDIKPEDYLSPYGAGDKIIVNEDIVYVLIKGESITDVRNFQAEKIERNYYRFTFIFADDFITW